VPWVLGLSGTSGAFQVISSYIRHCGHTSSLLNFPLISAPSKCRDCRAWPPRIVSWSFLGTYCLGWFWTHRTRIPNYRPYPGNCGIFLQVLQAFWRNVTCTKQVSSFHPMVKTGFSIYLPIHFVIYVICLHIFISFPHERAINGPRQVAEGNPRNRGPLRLPQKWRRREESARQCSRSCACNDWIQYIIWYNIT